MLIHQVYILLRPKQWIKNLFVLAPLFFSQSFLQPDPVKRAITAALLFCIMSSAVYVFNDIFDLERDRLHPEKQKRPLPSGMVPLSLAYALTASLTLVALAFSWFICFELTFLLGMYFAINIGYSLYLKHVPILDVFCISSGFILRVLAGGVVCSVYISQWLLLCTMTLSLLMAFGKRREELTIIGKDNSNQRPSLEGYSLGFIDHAISTVATLTIICYILYVADAETIKFYGTRTVLLTSVFVLYGVFYYLSLLQTHQQGGNPVTILLSDRHLQFTCLGWVFSWILIIVI